MPGYSWPDRDERADQLAPIALELVQRIREDDPTRLCRELLGRMDGWELWALICLLAAAVDPNVDQRVLWGWVTYRDALDRATPIVWDEAEEPADTEPTSDEVNARIAALAQSGRGLTDEEIGREVGLSRSAVGKRRRQMAVAGLRRGDVHNARVAAAARHREEQAAA